MSEHNGAHDHEHPPSPLPNDIDVTDIFAVIDAIAFREIDHHSVDARAVHKIRKAIEPLLNELLLALHDSRAMGPGQQWTIPIGLDCGFEGDLIVRVRKLGPDHKAARRGAR